MRRYSNFLLLIIAFSSFGLYAQFDPKPQIQRPSSDAQSLGKFGEIPVDLHTGRVNINIPIHVIKYHDIEVPISISYHGGGIKVKDECGSVGLGWTLNVGGVINRITRGIPDNLHDNKVAGFEKLDNLILTNGLNKFKDFINLLKGTNGERDPTALQEPRTSEEREKSYMIYLYGEEYDKGHFDTSPDNYNFNVQGLSGAFVYNANNIILQSNDGVSITKGASGYTITDVDGYVYQLKEEEKQTYFYKVGYNWSLSNYDFRTEYCHKYTSSWWLSSITSPTGEKIDFYYKEAKIVYPRATFYGYMQGFRPIPGRCDFYPEVNAFNSIGQTPDTVYKKLLDRIETPNSVVRFNYQLNNYLLRKSPELLNIAIFARTNLTQAVEVTKFMYSGPSSKAKLLKIQRQGKSKEEKQTYSFSYTYKPSSMDLPETDDERYDHWGYFAPASKGTFPRRKYPHIGQLLGHGQIQFSSRNANSATATNNMLSKITYPTGGTTEFVWEPHSYSELSKLATTASASSPPEDNPNESGTSTEWRIDKAIRLCGKSGNEILKGSYNPSRPYTIKLDLSKYYPIDLEGGVSRAETCFSYWSYGDNYNENDILDRPHILVKENGKLIKLIHICEETILRPITIGTIFKANYTFELKNPREAFNQNIVECSFLYDEYFNRPETDYGYVNIEFGYEQPIFDEFVGLDGIGYTVGGVRIKQITNKSGGKITSIKKYDYIKDPDDPHSPSSGVLAYLPRYESFMQRCITVECFGQSGAVARVTHCPYLLTLRSNGLPYSLNGGSHIEYSKVTESFFSFSEKPIRRTVYSYWTGADIGCSDIDDTDYRMFIPADMLQLTSQNHFRGHLKEKIEYTDERKVHTYRYEILEKPVTETITGSPFTVGDYTETGFWFENNQGIIFKPYKDLGIVEYRVIPYNKRLLSVTSEGAKSKDYHAYSYANKIYSEFKGSNAPLSYTTIDSQGDTITRHFTYLSANLNRIYTCVTEKKGKIIDAYRNEYDKQGRIIEKYSAMLNPNNLPSAKRYNAVKLTNKLTASYLYNNNRLVQYTDHHSDISTVYLWSYNNTYPIAEIQNSTFITVCNILGKNAVNNLHYTLNPDMEIVNALRNRLKESSISTMTYELLRGISSFTDPRGTTTYYEYNSFGELKECYIFENGQKKILQKKEYYWTQ